VYYEGGIFGTPGNSTGGPVRRKYYNYLTYSRSVNYCIRND